MSFVSGTRGPARGGSEVVLFRDPIASGALSSYFDGSPLDGNTGVGGWANDGGMDTYTGLGIFGIDDALIAVAIPAVIKGINGVKNSSAAIADPVAAVWQALPASAIGAHVGSDGWWYDNADGHKLSHEEAAQRQQQVTAATINARVGANGWWLDMTDGHQLSHAEAWQRYEALMNGTPMPGGPSSSPPINPNTGQPYTFPTTQVPQPTGEQPTGWQPFFPPVYQPPIMYTPATPPYRPTQPTNTPPYRPTTPRATSPFALAGVSTPMLIGGALLLAVVASGALKRR